MLKKQLSKNGESGQVTNLKKSIIKQLSEIFGVLPSYLMGMEDVVDLQPKIPDIFDSAEEAVKFILEQPLVMAYGGYNLETMSDEEIINFANDILFAVKIAAERRKKKNR